MFNTATCYWHLRTNTWRKMFVSAQTWADMTLGALKNHVSSQVSVFFLELRAQNLPDYAAPVIERSTYERESCQRILGPYEIVECYRNAVRPDEAPWLATEILAPVTD
ncbi:hypothetical protein AC579_5074 [Pseudocercospora musae]|uniref:Uncharacterized protein n=1 Tax=Pseudocercospora musae TaxID=113226 RepID=A0A139IN86_9PEZI|nr:hypothetical protein AC579_5074 [Pseudocercospora musae]